MSRFESRKKLLAAESEMYRQLLKLEIQTFKIYGARTRRRFTSIKTYLPLVMSGMPILNGLFGRKRQSSGFSLKQLGPLFLLGLKAFGKFAPLFGQGKSQEGKKEPPETAAEDYLWRKL
jgi:hypothetical protein